MPKKLQLKLDRFGDLEMLEKMKAHFSEFGIVSLSTLIDGTELSTP